MTLYSEAGFMRDFIGTRKLWKHKGLLNRAWKAGYAVTDDREEVFTHEEATLVGSMDGPDSHLPVLDIDFPAALVPSSTPDHYHLYMNQPMSWPAYKKLLRALYDCGVIEEGFYTMSIERGQTFVRFPGVRKRAGEEGS